MKSFKFIIFYILVIFLKTGNVLSENNLFFVNNIEIVNKNSTNIDVLANQAIKNGFNNLINKVLLKKDIEKLNDLTILQIRDLISYYQIKDKDKSNNAEDSLNSNKVIFNVTFDKDKIHDLFFKRNIQYSNLFQQELYLLPVFQKNKQLYIYTQNYFYSKWNEIHKSDYVEFILPLENIEIIEILNSSSNNIIDLDIREIFKEYGNSNLAIVYIEEKNSKINKVFLKTNIMGKNINKSLQIKNSNLDQIELYKNVIFKTKNEIVNLIKSQNLVDIRTPSFMNVKFLSNKKNNLVELKSRLNKIELIENIFVQEISSSYIDLKIKYIGKINKLIEQLKLQNISLKLDREEWSLSII